MQGAVISGTVPYALLIYLLGFGISVGRAWCGWVCPFGLFQDLINVRRDREWKRKLRITGKLLYLKFLVLALTILAAWYFADKLFCLYICPIITLEATIPLLPWTLEVNLEVISRLIIFVLVVVGVVITGRFWCRVLCPLGAIFGCFNKVAFLQIRSYPEKCIKGCVLCTRACPSRFMVPGAIKEGRLDNLECIRCGRCIDVCPRKALRFEFAGRG